MAYNQPPFIEAIKAHVVSGNVGYYLKTLLQKRISIIHVVLGKTSRVLTSQGLKCGLSGNRVIKMATFNYFPEREITCG
mgnify:CR=1 FL=1